MEINISTTLYVNTSIELDFAHNPASFPPIHLLIRFTGQQQYCDHWLLRRISRKGKAKRGEREKNVSETMLQLALKTQKATKSVLKNQDFHKKNCTCSFSPYCWYFFCFSFVLSVLHIIPKAGLCHSLLVGRMVWLSMRMVDRCATQWWALLQRLKRKWWEKFKESSKTGRGIFVQFHVLACALC